MAEGDTTKVLIQQELSEHIWPEIKTLQGRCAERGAEMSALQEIVKQSKKQTEIVAANVDKMDSKIVDLRLHVTEELAASVEQSRKTATEIGKKSFRSIFVAIAGLVAALLSVQTAIIGYFTLRTGSPTTSIVRLDPPRGGAASEARRIPRTLAP